MKKLKYLLVMLLTAVVVTGCGSKDKLTCTMKEEASGIEMAQTVTVKFKNDKANYIKLSMNNKATTEAIKQNWDLFANTLDSQFSSFEKTEGLKVTSKNNKDDYSYLLELEVDLDKISAEDMENMDLDISDDNSSYETIKKEFEEQGYSCK